MRSESFVLVTANRDLHWGFVGTLIGSWVGGVRLSNARAIRWKAPAQLPQAFRIASAGPDECTEVSPEVPSVEIQNVDLILEVTPKAEAAILALEEE